MYLEDYAKAIRIKENVKIPLVQKYLVLLVKGATANISREKDFEFEYVRAYKGHRYIMDLSSVRFTVDELNRFPAGSYELIF